MKMGDQEDREKDCAKIEKSMTEDAIAAKVPVLLLSVGRC